MSSSQIECGCHRLKFVTSFNKFPDQNKIMPTKLCKMLDTVCKEQPPGSPNSESFHAIVCFSQIISKNGLSPFYDRKMEAS